MRIKQFLLPVALVVPIVLALLLINPTPSSIQPTLSGKDEFLQNPTAPKIPTSTKPLVKQEQLQAVDDFDSALALTLLSEIALDENGALTIDNTLKQQLDNAVRLIGRDRSPAELDKLNELITQAFKPHTAQAINHVLFQYYTYKAAEEDFINSLSVTNTSDVTRNSKSLVNLRESYLGHELANKLFSEDDTYHNFMAELTERLSSADLTEDMRTTITTETRKKYYPHQEETPEGL